MIAFTSTPMINEVKTWGVIMALTNWILSKAVPASPALFAWKFVQQPTRKKNGNGIVYAITIALIVWYQDIYTYMYNLYKSTFQRM